MTQIGPKRWRYRFARIQNPNNILDCTICSIFMYSISLHIRAFFFFLFLFCSLFCSIAFHFTIFTYSLYPIYFYFDSRIIINWLSNYFFFFIRFEAKIYEKNETNEQCATKELTIVQEFVLWNFGTGSFDWIYLNRVCIYLPIIWLYMTNWMVWMEMFQNWILILFPSTFR